MKALITTAVLFISFNVSIKGQNVFPVGSGTFTGIGTTTPATGLHILKHTTNLDAANFITIDNRGANPTNGAVFSTSHVVGGLLFAAFRDVRTPSNGAGIWAYRNSYVGGLSSGVDIVFGAMGNGTNIQADNVLPTERMRITYSGNIGIGTSSPTGKLDIVVPSGTGADTDAAVNIQDGAISQQRLKIGVNSVSDYAYLQSTLSGTGAKDIMLNPLGGNVGIGTVDTKGHTLAVAGDIIATKIMVKQQANWADYVFEPTYKLPSLQSVENFILFNRHLPDVPSAEKVAKDGINLGDNQAVLLKKIEELTLYLIEQNKKQESLQKEMEILKEKLEHAMGNTN